MRNRFDQAQCVLQWLMASLYSCLWTYFKCSFIGRDTLGEREVSFYSSHGCHIHQNLSPEDRFYRQRHIKVLCTVLQETRDSTASLGAPLPALPAEAPIDCRPEQTEHESSFVCKVDASYS